MTETLSYELTHRPDFAMLKVALQPGQKIFAEPSAMASMDPSIRLESGLKGGLMASVGRALGGESLIVNTFSADQTPGEVVFAPGAMGDMQHYRLDGNRIMLQRGAFVAHGEGVNINGKFDGIRGFFSGEGLVLLEASGTGDLFFNTYGSMLAIDVNGGYFVDTGYIVAFEDTLHYDVAPLPGLSLGEQLWHHFLGGEGIVCRFSGQGRLWIQTRNLAPYLNFLYPYRPLKKDKND